jgi:hypothetical protein
MKNQGFSDVHQMLRYVYHQTKRHFSNILLNANLPIRLFLVANNPVFCGRVYITTTIVSLQGQLRQLRKLRKLRKYLINA